MLLSIVSEKKNKLVLPSSNLLENTMFKYFRFNTQEATINVSYARECIEHIGHLFHIIITDHYDESFLLLKEDLCWNIKDIIFLSHKNASFPSKNKTPEEYGLLYEMHKNISVLDYELYNYFFSAHRQRVKQGGDEFQKKLSVYQDMKNEATTFCWNIIDELVSKKNHSVIQGILSRVIYVNGRGTFESIEISGYECVLMSLCEADCKSARLALNYPVSCTKQIPGIILKNKIFCPNSTLKEVDVFHYSNVYFPLNAMAKLLKCDLLIVHKN